MEQFLLIISLILLLAYLCWKESRRKNKANRTLRVIASALAIVAIYFMAQPLVLQRSVAAGQGNTAALLTEGYDADSLSELNKLPLFSTSRQIAATHKNVTFIPDLQDFLQSRIDIHTLHLLGGGVETHELDQLKGYRLLFHPAAASGFVSVSWNRSIRSGEQLLVQGRYVNKSSKVVKILLQGLSTTLDSLLVPARQEKTFELATDPKLLGRAVYSLLALSGRDTLAKEPVPVYIQEKQTLNILVLSSSPDFESKFLKNWLYQENYALAVRSSISKDKYSTEFLNTTQKNLNQISPSLLQGFDILISDLSELSSLSATENAALQSQVSQGLGLFIRADSAGGKGFYRESFNLRSNRNADQKNITLHWAAHNAGKPGAGQPLEITPRNDEQVLVRDSKGQVVVSSRLYGTGRIIISTLPDTYTWMLGNQAAEYSSYWSYLLAKAARPISSSQSWSLSSGFPIKDSPVTLNLHANPDTIPAALAANSTLSFAQDAREQFSWSAPYWPAQTGWTLLRSGKQETYWYVFDHQDWQSIRMVQRIKATQRFISENTATENSRTQDLTTYSYTVPAIYFFMLLLLCCAYLWIEVKFLS